jgi:spore coat protein U-like protein
MLDIYRDAANTQMWGDRTGNTYTQAWVGTGTTQRYIVHDHISQGQMQGAGFYNDVISEKVNW